MKITYINLKYNEIMEANNKHRLLSLINILTRFSDADHKISLNDIVQKLEAEGISINNRKTIYSDIKVLQNFGYDIEYDNGYSLIEAPFTVSEIKILLDSLHSLKNIDSNMVDKIDTKLYRFLSEYEEESLRKLTYENKHSDKKFIFQLESALYAINNHLLINVSISKKKTSSIGPCFLYRQNDYYYLYYHYKDNEKLYKTRFDNITSLELTEEKDMITIPSSTIRKYIEEGTGVYNKGKVELIKFEILNDSDYLRSRLFDDFSNIVFTRNGFTIRSSINNVFFSKLTAYGEEIKISDRNIADQYIEFLNSIITRNK